MDTAGIANSVEHSDGVLFIPSFSGIQAPINDSGAAAGFIGIKPTTRPTHLVRAVLESVALRVAQVYSVMTRETHHRSSFIRLDGGVSKNDFIAQMAADLTGVEVERADCVEMSARGAAYLAGISAGLWKDKEEILKLRNVERSFKPNGKQIVEEKLMSDWQRALTRFLSWYS